MSVRPIVLHLYTVLGAHTAFIMLLCLLCRVITAYSKDALYDCNRANCLGEAGCLKLSKHDSDHEVMQLFHVSFVRREALQAAWKSVFVIALF